MLYVVEFPLNGVNEYVTNQLFGDLSTGLTRSKKVEADMGLSVKSIKFIIIRQPLCPVVVRRPQHVVSK